jgi:2-methylisocitrate lyase-like PEP mutase family enzyme
MDAVTGVRTELIPLPELARTGVGRVSIPVASLLMAHKALSDFLRALRASETGILASQTHWLSSFQRLHRLCRVD